MRPILVEDSTKQALPLHVDKIITSVTSQLENETTQSDLMVAILFVLLLEAGFTPVYEDEDDDDDEEPVYGNEFNIRRLQHTCLLPRDWRRNDGASYLMKFKLEPFKSYNISFLLITNENNMVDNLIVNLLVPQLESNGRCICFHPSRYVLSNNPRNAGKFQKLKQLSMLFKDAVCYPIRCEILQRNNLVNASLLGIPDELKLNILLYLTVRDLGALAKTSKALQAFVGDQRLWKGFVERDFGKDSFKRDTTTEDEVNWKLDYKNRFVAQLKLWKERERINNIRIQFQDYDDDDESYPDFDSHEDLTRNANHSHNADLYIQTGAS